MRPSWARACRNEVRLGPASDNVRPVFSILARDYAQNETRASGSITLGLTNFALARNVYDSKGNMTTNNNNHNVLVYNDENHFHYQNNPVTIAAGDTRTDFIYDGLGRLRKRIEWVVSCSGGQGIVAGGGAQPNSGGGGGNNYTWGEVSETWYIYDGMRVVYPVR